MSKSETIRKLLQQGKEPVEAAKEAGATTTLAYRIKNEDKRKATKNKAMKVKTKAKAKAKTAKQPSMTFEQSSSFVVWRAKNGGSALFASKAAAKTYLGEQTHVIPVVVLP